MISAADLKELIDRLTGEEELSDDDLDQLIGNVSSYSTLPRPGFLCPQKKLIRFVCFTICTKLYKTEFVVKNV